jgi:hypothetical protein
MKNRKVPETVKAYIGAHATLTVRGLHSALQRLDNQASTTLKQFSIGQDIDFQLVPPHLHCHNATERAIPPFKNHFIAGLCCAVFPLHLWHRLLPETLVTLSSPRLASPLPRSLAQQRFRLLSHNNGSTLLTSPRPRNPLHVEPGHPAPALRP